MRSRRFGVVKMGSLTASRVDGDIEAARQNLAASLAAPPQPEAPAKAMTPAALKLAGGRGPARGICWRWHDTWLGGMSSWAPGEGGGA